MLRLIALHAVVIFGMSAAALAQERGPDGHWHLDTFSDTKSAEASRGPTGTVVESHGKHWLFTIAEQSYRPRGGERVAIIGPHETAGHRHPGPEAWFILSGGQCLETPNGVMVGLAGQSMLAPEGWPMAISSFGPDTRRAVFMVLHPTEMSYVMPVDAKPDSPHAQWKPKGLCAGLKHVSP